MLDVTPLLRRYARRREAALLAQDEAATQARVLLGLVQTARHTAFGKAHDFACMRSIADYQTRVPLRRYEDFWRDWWQPHFPVLRDITWPGVIPFFAESSGTTAGVSKYIPVSREMMRSNRAGARDTLAFHVQHHAGARLLGGRNLFLGGSAALRALAPGVRSGDLSGIASVTMPWIARRRAAPPLDVALIADWDEKLDRLARSALGQDIRSISGTPSWLLMLFARFSALHPDHPHRLADMFPGLELIVHGGTGFAPYRDIVGQWLDGARAETREVYAASEGYIATADAGPDDGLRPMLDRGIFLEFIRIADLQEAQPARLTIADVSEGVDYAIAVTTNAGLWSAVIGDVVRFVSRAPSRMIVAGRLAHGLSVFGEHVIGAEMDLAIDEAARAMGGYVADYTAAARLPSAGSPRGRHVFAVELRGVRDADADRFASIVDGVLLRSNADYATHRAGDVQLLAPEVVFVADGAFERWMRRRGRLGGQNKVPRVLATEAELRGITEDMG